MKVSSNTAALMVAVFLLLANQLTFAQANVRQSTPAVNAPPANQAPASLPAASSNRIFDPSSQMQLLQDEIMSLRGLVEEQAFEIRRLKQQRLDDYLDFDKRITELEARKIEGPAVTTTAPVLPQVNPLNDTNVEERQLYNDAIDQLIDKQDYAGAKQKFELYSNTYPDGIYAANVQYWLGQIFLTEGNTESAEKAFLKIVESYPEHQKAPDAQFKLAKIYFDNNEKDNAKALLEMLAAGDTESARFAKAFLEENY